MINRKISRLSTETDVHIFKYFSFLFAFFFDLCLNESSLSLNADSSDAFSFVGSNILSPHVIPISFPGSNFPAQNEVRVGLQWEDF